MISRKERIEPRRIERERACPAVAFARFGETEFCSATRGVVAVDRKLNM